MMRCGFTFWRGHCRAKATHVAVASVYPKDMGTGRITHEAVWAPWLWGGVGSPHAKHCQTHAVEIAARRQAARKAGRLP